MYEVIERVSVDLKWIKSGKAIFTVKSITGEYVTYKVVKKRQTSKEKEKGVPLVYYAHVLTGPNNTQDYTYLGVVDFTNTEDAVRTTYKSFRYKDSKQYKVLSWLIRTLGKGKALDKGYSVYHLDYCGACGRPLTTPDSVKSGYGPTCIQNL